MPISATGTWSNSLRPQRGFTLLELLVVLVIVGITISFAVLSVGDGGRGDRLEQEAQRLVALVELAGEEALINGRELGLQIYPAGYAFMALGEGEWQLLEGDQSLRPRKLPEGVGLRLTLEGIAVGLEPRDEELPPEPQILLLSSGERSPFEIELLDPADAPKERQQRFRILAAPVGRPQLQGPLTGEAW